MHAKHFACDGHAVRELDARGTRAFVVRAPGLVLQGTPSHATVRKHCMDAHRRALRDHGLSSAIGTRKVRVQGSLLSVESKIHDDVHITSVFAKSY